MGAAKIVGLLCIVFGIADVALSWLGVADLTGVTWSPMWRSWLAAFSCESVETTAHSAGGVFGLPIP